MHPDSDYNLMENQKVEKENTTEIKVFTYKIINILNDVINENEPLQTTD